MHALLYIGRCFHVVKGAADVWIFAGQLNLRCSRMGDGFTNQFAHDIPGLEIQRVCIQKK